MLAVAAMVALLAGVGAVRLVLDEVVRSRRDAAEDRASQARAYQKMDARRADEHATFATMMTTKLDDATASVGELRGTLRLAERRAELAEQRARHESRRRGELQDRLDAIAVDPGRPTDDESGAAEGGGDAAPYWDPDLPTVVDLLGWEDRALDAPTASDASKADLA